MPPSSAAREELERIDRHAVAADLEVQPRLALGAEAPRSDPFSARDVLPLHQDQLAVVPVGCQVGLVMLDDHELPIADETAARIHDAALCRRAHGVGRLAADSDTERY